MSKFCIGLAALSAVLAAPLLADMQAYPREGVAEIENGVAAPFIGAWSLGFPEGDGVIVSERIVGCDAPVRLEDGGEGTLIYLSPEGGEASFELTAFAGRTTWLPEAGESILAVWVDADQFFIYTVDATNGKARWDAPKVFRRCD